MVSLNAAAIELLLKKGLSAEEILEVARAVEGKPSLDAQRQARYRARRDVSASEWESIRWRVFERDGFECQYCGEKEDLACDHVLPLIQGGKSTMENLTTACRVCNCGKSGRTPDEWLA